MKQIQALVFEIFWIFLFFVLSIFYLQLVEYVDAKLMDRESVDMEK